MYQRQLMKGELADAMEVRPLPARHLQRTGMSARKFFLLLFFWAMVAPHPCRDAQVFPTGAPLKPGAMCSRLQQVASTGGRAQGAAKRTGKAAAFTREELRRLFSLDASTLCETADLLRPAAPAGDWEARAHCAVHTVAAAVTAHTHLGKTCWCMFAQFHHLRCKDQQRPGCFDRLAPGRSPA